MPRNKITKATAIVSISVKMKIMLALLALLTTLPILAVLLADAHAATSPNIEKNSATLRVLDKITARVQEVDATIGKSFAFSSLVIVAAKCFVTPADEQPEAAVLVRITDLRPGYTETEIFHGWMFASSPAISALEHPVYDVWVTGCK